MNKKILLLFVIFMAFLSMGAVSANNLTEDVNAVYEIDDSSQLNNDNDLSIAVDNLNEQSRDMSFTALNETIYSQSNVINLTRDYAFNEAYDENFSIGIEITKSNFVINGNNHIIDGKNKAAIFFIGARNVTFNDIIFKNTPSSAINLIGQLKTNNVEFNNCGGDAGGAIYARFSNYTSENDRFFDSNASRGAGIFLQNSNMSLSNAIFKNNNQIQWALIYVVGSKMEITNTTFANVSSRYATAIYASESQSTIRKSRFINLFANYTAGAIAFKQSNNVTIEDCEFINCTSLKNGGAIFIDMRAVGGSGKGSISINNTLFDDCLSDFGGACLQLGGKLTLSNSNFTNNFATYNGGAVYVSNATASIQKSVFKENNAFWYHGDYPNYGGAVFVDYSNVTIADCKLINNHAMNGSALDIYDSTYDLDNIEFDGNGNAIHTIFDGNGSKVGYLYGADNISDENFNNVEYLEVIEGEGMQIAFLNNTINVTDLPARYDLRELSLVTPVKNQGAMGSCWTFGMMAALESALLKSMNYSCDFSENNMQNSMIVYSKYGDIKETEGADNKNALAYLLSWLGAFPEYYDSYDELGKISPLIRTDEDIHVQDVVLMRYFPGNSTSINNVKQAILKYGALDGALFSKASWDDENQTKYFNENTSAQYVPIYLNATHEICVVGWDDNYSKDNFLITPQGNGAWIVKNSWGTDWGDKGYFYVSYYDQTLCANPNVVIESFSAIVLENTLPYNRNYQYDFSGFSKFSKSRTPVTYLNNFKSYGDDAIAAVGTYFDEEGVNYTVEIKVNDNSVYVQSGVSPYYGYHTIKLDKYVSIKAGDNFTVLITSNAVPLCTNSRLHYEKGSSLLYDDSTWNDLTENRSVACLKVYSLPNFINADNIVEYSSDNKPFIVNVNASGVDVVVSIGGVNITNVSNENGIAKFELPLMDCGIHAITTYFNGTAVINTVEVLRSIDVSTNVTVAVNGKVNVKAIFYDENGEILANATVNVSYGEKTYEKTTDGNGSLTLTVSDKMGNEIVFANPATGEIVKTTINVVSRFSDNKDIKMYYFDGTKYSVKVYGDNGKPVGKNKVVVIKINKQTYNVETNSKGLAVLRISKQITPGKYKITAKYAGQTVKNTLKVKQSLTSKKTTVKKSAKKLVLKASLKNGKTPLKSKKITFKFNGKTYKVKTNKKGIAKKTLNKKVIKKLKKGKSYTVKVTYLKVTIKTTVKVK